MAFQLGSVWFCHRENSRTSGSTRMRVTPYATISRVHTSTETKSVCSAWWSHKIPMAQSPIEYQTGTHRKSMHDPIPSKVTETSCLQSRLLNQRAIHTRQHIVSRTERVGRSGSHSRNSTGGERNLSNSATSLRLSLSTGGIEWWNWSGLHD